MQCTERKPPSPFQRHVTVMPDNDPCLVYLDSLISGRNERRLPIVVVVNLLRVNGVGDEKPERTYTDNISPHGARVHTARTWQVGEQAEIIPVKGEAPVRGEVVYCQKLDDSDFFIGLKFPPAGILWSILQRYDGINGSRRT